MNVAVRVDVRDGDPVPTDELDLGCDLAFDLCRRDLPEQGPLADDVRFEKTSFAIDLPKVANRTAAIRRCAATSDRCPRPTVYSNRGRQTMLSSLRPSAAGHEVG